MSNLPATGFEVRTDDEAFDLLLDEIGERLRRGETLDVDACAERYPEFAERLRRVLPGMQALAELGHVQTTDDGPPEAGGTSSTRTLGDYQIVREIGRGGMGVVYEAEQLSLERRVALKVLPFAAVLDERQIKRFKNEALAAAQLDHPHIVDVYGVGCERAVHFYAMRYVEGNSLAEIIAHLRSLSRKTPQEPTPGSGSAETQIGGSGSMESAAEPETTAPADTDALAALSTDGATDTREFFASVARIGIEVAEALDHAHQQGVTHRDVKPANIIIDATGKAWVTDFGLARLETSGTLTMTGDLLGTLRYMSPEQALAKRVVVDHRTDVYSLGVTLYELLALEPAFPDKDRSELLRKIALEDPPSPKQLNSAIPRELETIVLKAISKSPSERYLTAQELAEDLTRFVNDQPIRARRPTVGERAVKWTRRHRFAVRVGVGLLLLVAFGSLLSTAFIIRERDAAIYQRDVARENLYFANIRLARMDWEDGNISRMLGLLDALRPEPGDPDLRGWEWYYLYSLPKRNVRTFYGHSGPVLCTSWSPDGLRIASGGTDGTVKIWDAATGRHLLTLRGHDAPVRGVSWSPDGVGLASGSGSYVPWKPDGARFEGPPVQHTVMIWDTREAEAVKELTFEVDAFAWAVPIDWSPDGKFVACGSHRNVHVWESEEWRLVFESPQRVHTTSSVVWRPDSRRLAWCDDFGHLWIWDSASGEEQSFSFPIGGTLSIDWNHDGKQIAINGRESIAVCRTDEDFDTLHTLGRHAGQVNSIDWSSVNHQMATASHDGLIKVWDPETKEELLTLRGHEGWVHSVEWSPDARRLVSAGDDGTVRTWDVSPQDSSILPGRERAIWHPDGRRLAVTAKPDFSIVSIVDALSREELFRFDEKFEEFVAGLAFSSDGSRLAAVSADGTMRVWDVSTRRQLYHLAINTNYMRETRAVSWSRDDRFIATGGMTHEVFVWDAATGEEAFRLSGHKNTIGTVVWSPDGARIASASWDQVVKIWDVKSRQEVIHLQRDGSLNAGSKINGADSQHSVLWSPDGSMLYTGNDRGEIAVWNTNTGRELTRSRGHRSMVRGLALSPDGSRLASIGNDGVIRIWDTARLRELLALSIPDAGRSVSWSPDGRQLVSGHSRALSLWDASLGYTSD